MSDSAENRLLAALQKIEKRIQLAEARPTLEEIEKLKAEREEDLILIKKLRADIKKAIEGSGHE